MSGLTAEAVVRAAGDRLKQAGIENGLQEARWFFNHATSGSPFNSVPFSMRHVAPDQIAAFEALIVRRAAREPLQHIIGTASFYDLELKTDRRALIPREDSYEVISLAQRVLMDAGHTPENVYPSSGGSFIAADLGTGSGVLMAALLSDFLQATGIVVEQSAEAMSLARENFEALGYSGRIDCFTGSWADWTGWGKCDLIISNPPYIRSEVIPTLEPEVRDHDPHEALDGGADGLNAYREIITLAAAQMKTGAHLVFEIGYDQKQAVASLLENANFTDLRDEKDLSGHDRAITARKG